MPQGISGASISGFEQLIDNWNKEVIQITNGARGGLIEAAVMIQRETESKTPLTPRLTGNMILSWQNTPIRVGKMYGIEFGYNANYSKWVHFMDGAKKWTRPGSGPRWFEIALTRNHDRFMQIVAAGIKPKL